MKCRSCGAPRAAVKVHLSAGPEAQEIHLCKSCASELGISARDTAYTPGELYSVLLRGTAVGDDTESRLICPGCMRSYDDLRRTGRAGCPECYEVFERQIAAVLSRSTPEQSHQGRIPRRLAPYKSIFFDKPRIQGEIEAAVAAENYEEAVFLRDRLRRFDEIGFMNDTAQEPPE
ncbi:MAG: UvrB/UvrC motif-containing protein [Spirochaeta sp.]|nr:UvrB/UvrC motif-containing protein [Spirochaeta sp.]